MSVEEDIELRDLVAQTLETNGCLAKIRAELRASIFLALDEDDRVSEQKPLLNNKIKTYLETPEGKAMFCIVREFLEFFNLFFTISVYEPESYLGTTYQYEGRHKIVKDLGLEHLEDTAVPLLMQLIKIAQKKTKIDINLNLNSNNNESLNHNNNSGSVNTKTETNSNTLSTHLNHNMNQKNCFNDIDIIEKNDNLNATFDMSGPTSNVLLKQSNDIHVNHTPKVSNNTDEDTYEDTSSIAEDSVAIVNSENSVKVPLQSLSNGIPIITILDDSITVNNETESVVKEVKTRLDPEKPKSSPQKPEIMKSKNSLSSLSDLPPLQLNKSKVSDILPSLYSKEFKEKSNLKELDKMFDMDADYEEDFICSGDELSLGLLGQSKLNISSEDSSSQSASPEKSPISNKVDLSTTSNKFISDCVKPVLKSLSSSPRSSFKESHRSTKDKS